MDNYSPKPNFIEAFFQQDVTKLKGTLMDELVHYLVRKSFGQDIPHTHTNDFMTIVKSVISYVSSYIKEYDSNDQVQIQKKFFTALQDISAKNSIIPAGILELIKIKFDPDELHLDDFNHLIEFSNSCGARYPTFSLILEEMLPRSVALIIEFQVRNIRKFISYQNQIKFLHERIVIAQSYSQKMINCMELYSNID